MSETTSILELPMDPAGGGNNIILQANEHATNQKTPHVSLDQSTISQIIRGLQQASATSATQLPSRDIPKTTDSITNDAQVQPNYIPQNPHEEDYIKNQENTENILSAYNNNLNDTYNEIQTPLLLAVLYFLFQLHIFKKYLFTYIPSLFSKDGNYNINGYVFTSILFGFIFYKFNKLITIFNAF